MLSRIAFSVERIAYSKNKSTFYSSLSAKGYSLNARKSAIRCQLSAKKGFTLAELLIAVSLVGMIILAIVAVDVASRKFVNSSDYEARVQNQIAPALEMIAKDVSRAVGNANTDPGVRQASATNIGARLDINPTTGNPNNTPGNYNDDTWIGYGFDSATHTIRRKICPNNSWPCVPAGTDPVIANHIISCVFQLGPPVRVEIGARQNPLLPANNTDNPEVTLETSVFPRGNSSN